MVRALSLFFLEQGPREGSLEHASRADVAVAAPSLLVASVDRMPTHWNNSSPYHQKVRFRIRRGVLEREDLGSAQILGQRNPQMRVVERAPVGALGVAHVGNLDVELRLAQSSPLDEDLDCDVVSGAARTARLRNVYVLEGEFSGATRGFLSMGRTRRETILNVL